MQAFQPYIITHLQLSAFENFTPQKGNHYLVIWCGQTPLGHAWINTNTSFSKEILLSAIKPALEYYMQFSADEAWKKFYNEKNIDQLNTVLKKSIDDFKAQMCNTQTKNISVIICTRNRPQALRQCLISLLKNDDKNFELIVVDNASDNNDTKNIVQQFSDVKYVFEKRPGLDIARNTGAKLALHEIIAYTDDDVKIPGNWISNIKSCFQNPLTMAVTGLVIPTELNAYSQYIFEKEWGFNKGYVPTVFNHAYFLNYKNEGVPAWDVGAGANMAFRREAFNIAGMFDERLDVGAAGCSGDSEIWYRILAEGWNCVYFPHVYVYHEHRSELKNLSKQLFSYMKGHVCALLVQYEKYGYAGDIKRIRKSLPAYYAKRIKNHIINTVKGNFSSLFIEIKGSIAGCKYYQQHKKFYQVNCLNFPETLYDEVVIDDNTLVSIIIPCYNQAHFLQQAIDSALNQTYKNIEVIVIDDGSQDDTGKVCAKYENVRLVRVERTGLSAARNIGVQFSKGSFLVFLDADDFLYPGAVELNLYYFSINKKAAFISGTYDKIDNEGNYLETSVAQCKPDFNYLSLLQGNYIAMEATVMYRRDLFFYFHFDTRLKSCEDYDLNLKISRALPVYHHEKKIAVYRMHESNMSKNTKVMLNNSLRVLKRQEAFLKNEEERNAYKQGIKNWEAYYSSP